MDAKEFLDWCASQDIVLADREALVIMNLKGHIRNPEFLVQEFEDTRPAPKVCWWCNEVAHWVFYEDDWELDSEWWYDENKPDSFYCGRYCYLYGKGYKFRNGKWIDPE